MSTPDPLANPVDLSPEIAAAIAAAVHMTFGPSAIVTSVSLPGETIGLENAPLIWALEGRRQIYSSHRVR